VVRWGAVKGLADGSLGSRTALFRAPYTDDALTSGVRVMALDLADIVVIDRDLTRIPAAEIHQARILATYVGGQARYES
jgi:predicted amidohydrolase YtcJ